MYHTQSVCKAFDNSVCCYCVTVTLVRGTGFLSKCLQQISLAGIDQFHQLCPVLQIFRGHILVCFQISCVLGFVLQQGNTEALAFKIPCGFHTVDITVTIYPSTGADLSKGKIIDPASCDEAIQQLHCISLNTVGQFHIIENRFCGASDMRAIVVAGLAAQKMHPPALKQFHKICLFQIA